MRYKVAPPARSLDVLREARAAVPLVPDSEGDCCRAIQHATGISDRETALAYLTFLQALGLVAESQRGYHRTRTDLDSERLRTAYRERVFLVSELVDAIETEPRTTTAAFEATRESVPRWERERHSDWERVWRERVEYLLGWAVVFDLLTVDSGVFERSTR